MELVEGAALDERLERGEVLDGEEAIDLLEQVASATCSYSRRGPRSPRQHKLSVGGSD